MYRLTRVSAGIGLVLLLVSTFVSHLSHTAQLPAILYGGGSRYLASLRVIAGFPVEFLGVLWFALVVAVSQD